MQLTLPDWLIIGAAKSGTTALHAMARRHPRISGGRVKEPRYFGSNWDRGLGWYAQQFAECPEGTMAVDASVEYTLASVAEGNPMVDRMAQTLPWARLVYIARDPVERIVSNLRMMSREDYFRGDDPLQDPERLEHVIRSDRIFLDRTRYWWHIQQYRRRFDDDRILALVHDDLDDQPDLVMDRLFRFLGLEGAPTEEIRTQVAPGGRRTAAEVLGPGLTARLRAELRPDTEAYLRYAGAPVDLWD